MTLFWKHKTKPFYTVAATPPSRDWIHSHDEPIDSSPVDSSFISTMAAIDLGMALSSDSGGGLFGGDSGSSIDTGSSFDAGGGSFGGGGADGSW